MRPKKDMEESVREMEERNDVLCFGHVSFSQSCFAIIQKSNQHMPIKL